MLHASSLSSGVGQVTQAARPAQTAVPDSRGKQVPSVNMSA